MFFNGFWVPAAAFALWMAGAAPLAGQAGRVDYPLALNTRWTYHLRQELGSGVHFEGDDAKVATGNVLDITVISEVAGFDTIDGLQYARIESRRSGKPWLTEWYRSGPQGLMVAKSINDGGETVMVPPQRRLSSRLQPGESWVWKAANAPVVFRTVVNAAGEADVPAGHYQAACLSTRGTIETEGAPVQVRQDSWFVSETGYVKQDTTTSVSGHLISHIVLTLEKFERSGQ